MGDQGWGYGPGYDPRYGLPPPPVPGRGARRLALGLGFTSLGLLALILVLVAVGVLTLFAGGFGLLVLVPTVYRAAIACALASLGVLVLGRCGSLGDRVVAGIPAALTLLVAVWHAAPHAPAGP